MMTEPTDVDTFWHHHADRRFMVSFYPKLSTYATVLDIGARGFNQRCKALINSSSSRYYQMEPFPSADFPMINDGTLECTVQDSLATYPAFRGFFDCVLDFGVFGWGQVRFTRKQLLAYLEAVRGLLKPGGLYVLKLDDKVTRARLTSVQDEAVTPFFRREGALGYPAELRVDVYTFIFMRLT